MSHPIGEAFQPLHSNSPGLALHRVAVMKPLMIRHSEVLPVTNRWGLTLYDILYIARNVFQLATVRGQGFKGFISKTSEYCSTEMPPRHRHRSAPRHTSGNGHTSRHRHRSGHGHTATPRHQVIHPRPPPDHYAAAFEPIRPDTGTYYPCSQRDIEDTIHFTRDHNGHYVSTRRAVHEIVSQNDLTRRPSDLEYAAIRRLRNAIDWCFRHRTWGPDLVIKAFKDLDTIFFCGRLAGIVKVKWVRHHPDFTGLCRRESSRSTRCKISLSADAILGSRERTPFNEMWATILHEMW